MSLTGQPSPRPVIGPASGYRWALVSTALALLVVLAVLATVVVTDRRPAVPVQALRPVHPSAGVGALASARRHHARLTSRRASTASIAMVHPHARTTLRPWVRITERRPKPVLRRAPSSVEMAAAPPPSPPEARAPRAQKVMGARWELRPAAQEQPIAPNQLISPPAGAAGEQDGPPEAIFQPQARYPAAAMAEGVTGSVRLKVIVNRRGRVEDAIVVRSSGDDRLDEAASASVLRWRYRPARRQGRSVPGIDYVVVDFYRDDGNRTGSPFPAQ